MSGSTPAPHQNTNPYGVRVGTGSRTRAIAVVAHAFAARAGLSCPLPLAEHPVHAGLSCPLPPAAHPVSEWPATA
jgi:hypothetical protein